MFWGDQTGLSKFAVEMAAYECRWGNVYQAAQPLVEKAAEGTEFGG